METTHQAIRNINDVLPAIAGRQDFVIARKDGYTVIDYVYALSDSFDCHIRRECRGIKFDADGDILARPFHKFFNIGEREDTQPHLLDFTSPHTVMEKLDGSMIHPAIVNGDVVFMTRMGRTEHAVKAERHLTPEVRDVCEALLRAGATPIFEWTAPDNRIVLRYDDSRLTLLAVRQNVGGEYWGASAIASLGLPTVETHDNTHTTAAGFLAYTRAMLGYEGFVVRFKNGLWVKAKADDYVMKHKAKDSILQEKNILRLVLDGGLDDVLPLLDDADAHAARAYRDAVDGGISKVSRDLAVFITGCDHLSQKDFATGPVQSLPSLLRPLAFAVRRGDSAFSAVRARIAANTNSQTQVDECRQLHGARWS